LIARHLSSALASSMPATFTAESHANRDMTSFAPPRLWELDQTNTLTSTGVASPFRALRD